MSKGSRPEIKKPDMQPVNSNAFFRLRTSLGIVTAAFAFILYSQSISFDYTLDDNAAIKDNVITTRGFSGIPTLLKTDYWNGTKEAVRVPQYRPGPLVLFAIEWQFFPNSPHAAHLVNVLIFAVTCWLLYILLCELFANVTTSAKTEGQKIHSLLVPFICSLLYVSHPIHTEVVNSVKSCDEMLCFLFSILTTLLIIQYVKSKSLPALISALIFYFAAVLSKETGLTFLIIIPLTIFIFTNANYRQVGIVTLLLWLVTVVYLLIRAQILKSFPSSIDSVLNNTLFGAPDFISREATAFYILLRYIGLLIFPHPLVYDYSYSQVKIHSISDPSSLMGILVYSALGIYAIINIRKKSIVAFAILFYLITLAVTSNVFILIGATMAERFMYIPSMGYCIILALVLIKFTKTEVKKDKRSNSAKDKPVAIGLTQFFAGHSFLFTIVFVITAVFSIKTFARSGDWKNNYALYSHDVKISDLSARTHHNFGAAIIEIAYPAEKDKDRQKALLEQAISEYKKSIDIFPNSREYNLSLASAYSLIGDHLNSVHYFEAGLKMTPNPDWALFDNIGHEYLSANQFDLALSMEDSAIKYNPGYAKAYNNKGCALGAQGRYEESIPFFLKSIALDSAYADAYKNLAISYFNIKQYSKAVENYNHFLVFEPTAMRTYYFIGVCYQMMGDTAKAKPYIEKYNQWEATNH